MNPETFKISVVTPSLNHGDFLGRTITSVCKQTRPPEDYWVMDGASTDNTMDVLRECGSWVHWVSEKDEGQADAVNRGFQMGQGEILGWLNADDVYLPETLAIVEQEFRKNPSLMLLYGDANHIDENDVVLEPYPSLSFSLEVLAYHCFICQPTCFFRRSLWAVAGGLNPRLHYAMDLDLWIRFGKLQREHPEWRFKYIPEVLAHSRMYAANKTLSCRQKSFQEAMSVVKTHFKVVPFNLVYGFLEGSDPRYDGFFSRKPFSSLLFSHSLMLWIWKNWNHPLYLAQHICIGLTSPIQSARRIAARVRNRFA
jgi:glycosyltransferase involved in cell wall biosynthesis